MSKDIDQQIDKWEKIVSVIAFVVVIILIILVYIMSALIVLPEYESVYSVSYIMRIIQQFLFIALLYNMYKVHQTPQITNAFDYYREYNSYKKYCKKCKQNKYARVHHCSLCNTCVLRFDHHCNWLHSCIGLHNYKYFYCFIVYALIIVCLHMYISISIICNKVSFEYSDIVIVELVVCSVFFLSLIIYFMLHTYLISRNMTTLEFLQRLSHESEENYDKGILNNWKDAFHVDSLYEILLTFFFN